MIFWGRFLHMKVIFLRMLNENARAAYFFTYANENALFSVGSYVGKLFFAYDA